MSLYIPSREVVETKIRFTFGFPKCSERKVALHCIFRSAWNENSLCIGFSEVLGMKIRFTFLPPDGHKIIVFDIRCSYSATKFCHRLRRLHRFPVLQIKHNLFFKKLICENLCNLWQDRLNRGCVVTKFTN